MGACKCLTEHISAEKLKVKSPSGMKQVADTRSPTLLQEFVHNAINCSTLGLFAVR